MESLQVGETRLCDVIAKVGTGDIHVSSIRSDSSSETTLISISVDRQLSLLTRHSYFSIWTTFETDYLHAALDILQAMKLSNKTIQPLVGSVLAAVLIVLLLGHLDMHTALLQVLQQVEDAGFSGRFLFIMVVCLCVIGLVPSVLLTLGAGALYGVVGGSLTMVFAQTVGSTITFLFARYFFHKQVTGILSHHARLQRAMAVIRPHDWKMIALLRMLPFFPYKLSNYALGVTPVALTAYVFGTLIGLWPMTVFNVYLGSLSVDLLSLRSW